MYDRIREFMIVENRYLTTEEIADSLGLEAKQILNSLQRFRDREYYAPGYELSTKINLMNTKSRIYKLVRETD